MHTPIGSHSLSAQDATSAGAGGAVDGQFATPAVIAAGNRVTRELVRLFVAGAFVIMETLVRLTDTRVVKRLQAKRRA